MQPNTTPAQKTPSTRPSIAGGIFSILALLSSAIAYGLTHAESRSKTEVTTPVGKVTDGPVADAASNAVTSVLSLPFIAGATLFGLIALLFTLLRIRKVKTPGLIISIIWIALVFWALFIAFGVLSGMKADSA